MVFETIYEPSKAKTSVRISNSERVKQSRKETSVAEDVEEVGGEMVNVVMVGWWMEVSMEEVKRR